MQQPLDVLQQYWGFDAFRPLQEDIIRSVLDGRDTLALLPTGGGKSICFQVPALCQEGICLVISPLIALMKDQVYHLERRGISAAALFSGMSQRQIDMVFENACNGQYKFLYLSPERLKTTLAIERIKRMNVNLLAVDEAHCISQWGYDFRPPYLQIAEIRPLLPNVPILALTATATPEVLTDIQEKLAFRAPHVFRQSFVRSNLSYSVLYEDRKRDKLLDIIKNHPSGKVKLANDVDRIFALQPSLGVEINVFRWLHLGLEGGYRFISDSNLEGLDDAALSGGFGQATLRFGWSWGRTRHNKHREHHTSSHEKYND